MEEPTLWAVLTSFAPEWLVKLVPLESPYTMLNVWGNKLGTYILLFGFVCDTQPSCSMVSGFEQSTIWYVVLAMTNDVVCNSVDSTRLWAFI